MNNPSEKRVAVIGGGLAGITTALELAGRGASVVLIEKDDFIGGHAAHLTCKATDQCLACNLCLAEPRLRSVLSHPRVEILRRTRLVQVGPGTKGYTLLLEQRPAYINPASCTSCGQCIKVCPQAEAGAIRRAPVAGDVPRLALDPEHCLWFQDQRSTLCRDACPEEAIAFDLKPNQRELEVEALVVATGFAPYDAHGRERLGYGHVPNVVTALELETTLREQGEPRRPSDGAIPKRVAFIQCVGSRDVTGFNHCSRVCCGYALRLGRLLRHRHQAQVSVFYMDLQSYGVDPGAFLASAAEELNLVRSMPHTAMAGPEGSVLLSYQPPGSSEAKDEPFDLVVLSVGMTPGADSAELAQSLGLNRDGDGFLAAGGQGVFLAGAATGPMDLAEVAAQAGRAARETLRYLDAG